MVTEAEPVLIAQAGSGGELQGYTIDTGRRQAVVPYIDSFISLTSVFTSFLAGIILRTPVRIPSGKCKRLFEITVGSIGEGFCNTIRRI